MEHSRDIFNYEDHDDDSHSMIKTYEPPEFYLKLNEEQFKAIMDKLEEIRCGLIDVETAIEEN